jgi:hypothetical protein
MCHDIDEAITATQNHSFDLFTAWNGSQRILVEMYKDQLYVGIHSFDKSGQRARGKGLNLKLDEWNKLKTLCNDIDAAMTGQDFPEAWQYSEVKRPIFKWVWRTRDGDVKNDGKWTFSYQDCFQAALHTVDKCVFTIKEKYMTLPPASNLLVMCYDYLVQKTVKSIIRCNGCVIDHPSQAEHLDGCMMSTDTAMMLYSDEARRMLTVEQVMTLYNGVRQDLALPPTVGEFDVERYLMHVPLTFTTEKEYIRLFDKLV